MKKILSLFLAAAFAVCSFSAVSAEGRKDMQPCEGVGMNITGFSTTDLTGEFPVTSDILQNADVTIINFWADWCHYCTGEMPFLQAAHEYYSDTPEADVQIIGVVCEANGCTPETALAFLKENGYTWLNIRADAKLAAVFDTSRYIPQTIIADRSGAVRDHIIGGFSTREEVLSFAEMWLDAITNHEGDTCTVTYINGETGEALGTDTVLWGYPAVLQPPAPPAIEGHTFNEWVFDDNMWISGDEQLSYFAMGDVIATPSYTPSNYTVRFIDGVNGKILKIQHIDHGEAATPPTHPEHPGWEFIGWDADFSCITQDIDIHGICVPAEELPGDVDGDGTVSASDALLALRMALNLIEITPQADINGDGTVNAADALAILRIALEI